MLTVEPTEEPAVEPTVEPIEEPTAEPTVEPTEEPTEEPTAEPTEELTPEPIVEPTAEPTEMPTVEPTLEPTVEPTQTLTPEPTVEPTGEPTPEPSADLTEAPEDRAGEDVDGESTDETDAESTGGDGEKSGEGPGEKTADEIPDQTDAEPAEITVDGTPDDTGDESIGENDDASGEATDDASGEKKGDESGDVTGVQATGTPGDAGIWVYRATLDLSEADSPFSLAAWMDLAISAVENGGPAGDDTDALSPVASRVLSSEKCWEAGERASAASVAASEETLARAFVADEDASDVPISAFYADALDADANPFDANTLAPGADVNASDGTDPAADAFDAAAIAPEASHDESNRLAPQADATVSDPGMALASPEDWAIEYDDALLSVAFADDDYAVSPLHGFDVARVVVTAGNTAFELTLVNWTEPGDPEILAGVFSVPVSGADYAISVKVPEEARLPASARFEARAMEDDVYGSAALNAVTAAEGERRTLLALFDLTIYDGERVIQPEAPLTLGVELGDAVPGDARLTIVHFPGSGAQDGTEAIQADPPRLSLKKTQAVKRDEPASELIEAENIDGAAVFTADRFSVFAVVQTILEKVVLASDGHNYRITVRFGPEAGVPEGAALEVEEIVQQAEAVDGATAYEACVAEAPAALGMDAGAFDYARLRLRALFRHQHLL